MPPVEPQPPHGFDARAQQIEQCKAIILPAVGLLGPMHALLVGGPGTTAFIALLLLTAAQAFAVFSIISAIFIVKQLEKDADLDSFVVRIPIVCCSAAGALLVVATCVVHWKAACGIAVLAVAFLLAVHRGTVIAFGKRLVNWSAMLFSRVNSGVLKFGGWLENESAVLLTGVGNTALAFGGWLRMGYVTIVNRPRAPATEGPNLEMGVGNADDE